DDFLCKPLEKKELLDKIGYHLNVSYIYATDILRSQKLHQEPEAGEISLDQLPAYLEQMPTQWLDKIYDAAAQCSDDMILELLEEIPTNLEPLGQTLSKLAENFQFHQIMHLTYSEDL
ncbi:MAG: hypothetical protein ACRCU2_08080, partial [Planktothrix sp.]